MKMIKAPIRTILLIDDDKDDCDVFGQALTEINPLIKLECLHHCEEVLSALDNIKPDLIFLDINIPRINGYQCLKSLQSGFESSRTPVIMYSTSENPKDINVSYGLGATLYLKKPTRYSDLKQSIQSILNMAWEEPAMIKQQFFQDGKYRAYEVS